MESGAEAGLVVVEGLVKSYRAGDGTRATIVDVPDFVVRRGEEIGLEGASGTGKSTFLFLLAGLLRADAGSVRIGGTDIQALGEAAADRFRARAIGYVFQTFNLLQGFTALENVLLGMSFAGTPDPARARHLLDHLGLEAHHHHLPAQLSIGQQQRVALARALANRPALVLADEPTGSLDPRRAREAIDLILTTCREEGATLIVASHDHAVLAQCERVVSLESINRAAGRATGASA